MFERLQRKWNVSGLQLALILCTFAIGGSLTGYVGRRLMNYLPIEDRWIWVIIYVLVVTIIWPIMVILVSILFGQYKFFKTYIYKLVRRFGGKGQDKSLGSGYMSDDPDHSSKNSRFKTPQFRDQTNIAIFASGAGSNAQKIIEHFRYSPSVKIVLIGCNKVGAGVISIAEREHIDVLYIERDRFFNGDAYLPDLQGRQVDLIVLAGFLWKIPLALIKAFPGRIINIHPALLPKYGGKGMYGRYVHEAVLANKEKQSGISIHHVDEIYDNGRLLFQISCPVLESDTAISLAERIHKLEHEHYPRIIERFIKSQRL